MDTKQTLFAFRLAARQDETRGKWKAQEGRAAAGCTDYRFPGNVRAYSQVLGNDRGLYC